MTIPFEGAANIWSRSVNDIAQKIMMRISHLKVTKSDYSAMTQFMRTLEREGMPSLTNVFRHPDAKSVSELSVVTFDDAVFAFERTSVNFGAVYLHF